MKARKPFNARSANWATGSEKNGEWRKAGLTGSGRQLTVRSYARGALKQMRLRLWWAGRHRLLPLPLKKSPEPVEAWWDLSPRFEAPGEGWVQSLDPIASAGLPLYLGNQANYWLDYLPDSGILYFQYNRSEQISGALRGSAPCP